MINFDDFVQLIHRFGGTFAVDFGRYLFAAAAVSLALACLGDRLRANRTVRIRSEASERPGYEFLHSILAAAVFGAVGTGVYAGTETGIFRIYDDLGRMGGGYWALSLVLIVLSHDAYFYWTHRGLHSRALFPIAHRTHHESTAPTQWAAYSFSAGEALVHALFLPLFALFVPIHTGVIVAWLMHQIIRNALGHCGVELEPRRWLAGWWGRWLTTTLHHDLHHAHGRHNYGLYFTWWDRWCGTEHPEYRARLQRLVDALERDEPVTVANET